MEYTLAQSTGLMLQGAGIPANGGQGGESHCRLESELKGQSPGSRGTVPHVRRR